MKMNFFFTNVFWGILLVLWGLSLILKGLNIVDWPLGKIFIAVVIIMIGVRLLVGSKSSCSRSRERGTIHLSGDSEYTSVFSSQTVDLTDIDPNSNPIEITAVFGSTYVKLPNNIDFKIEQTAVFGSATAPTKPVTDKPPLGTVKIEATAVFGKVEFVYVNPKPGVDADVVEPADSTQGEPSE